MNLETLRDHPKWKQFNTLLEKVPMPDSQGFQMPRFWKGQGAWSTVLRELLLPASVIYYGGFLYDRSRKKVSRLSVPVWCVGNITVGGAGKTPFALMIGETLKSLGRKPAFISRGFGGILRDEWMKVDPATHSSADVGDEPLLLARVAPCYVSEQRAVAGRAAIADGADILIMDDGLQHHALHKDVSFLVIDGTFGFGNGGILPAGPLREPPHQVIPRVQAVVVVGEDRKELLKKHPVPQDKPVLRVDVEALPEWLKAHEDLKDKKLLPFAGIAMPEKFFDTLRRAGYLLVGNKTFPDHYAFRAEDLEALAQQAKTLGAQLITTEKDWVRLPQEFRDMVLYVPVRMVARDPEALLKTVQSLL